MRDLGDTSVSVVRNANDAVSDEPHRPQALTTLTLASKPGGSLTPPAPSSQPGPSRPGKRPKALHTWTSRPQGPPPAVRSGPPSAASLQDQDPSSVSTVSIVSPATEPYAERRGAADGAEDPEDDVGARIPATVTSQR